MQKRDDCIEIVVVRGFIEDFFTAFKALVDDLVAFFAVLFDSDRFHQSMAAAQTVSGNRLIDVKRKQAKSAMVSAGFFGFWIIFMAFFTDESFIDLNGVYPGLRFHGFYGIITR